MSDLYSYTVVNSSFTSLSDAQEIFKFYITTETTDNDYPYNKYGQNDNISWTAIPKSVSTSFINGDVGDFSTGAIQEGIQNLVGAITGNPQTEDYFNNQETMQSSFANSFTNMQTSVQNNVSPVASEELGQYLLTNKPERFALNYNAVGDSGAVLDANTSIYKRVKAFATGALRECTVIITNGNTLVSITPTGVCVGTFIEGMTVTFEDWMGGTNLQLVINSLTAHDKTQLNTNLGGNALTGTVNIVTAESGKYTFVPASSATSTQDANCTCSISLVDNIATVEQIYVNTHGAGFAKNDTITLTNGGNSTNGNIIIPSANSVQVATLNNTLDSPSSPTEMPMELEDIVRVKYEIRPSENQKNLAGQSLPDLAGTTSWFFDFKIT